MVSEAIKFSVTRWRSLETRRMTARIAVIGTGGSISTPARHDLDLYEYGQFSEPLQVDELMARFAPLLAGYSLLPVRFKAVDSVVMDSTLWLELHRQITETVEQDGRLDGVVVTHGTSSLEETAYFLQLTLRVQIPVVLVAAQRPPQAMGSDAGINLLNAVRVAASSAVAGAGVLVVINDEVHSAREVVKCSNFSLQAFQSPNFGTLGCVDPDGRVSLYRRPVRRHAPNVEFDIRGRVSLPEVEIVYCYAGASGRPIAALVAEGCPGLVFAGMPPGRASPAQEIELVHAAQAGVLVVQCSRAGTGRVVPRERDRAMGFVAADNLNAQKARVLAMLALTQTSDRAEIERMFSEY
jgi:L-asparaginase